MSNSILFLRSDVKLAGPGRLMLSSAEALRDAGAEVIFTTGGGAMVETIKSRGFQHIEMPELRVENRSVVSSIRAASKLVMIARRLGVTVIHSYNAHAGLAAIPAARLTGARLVNTVLGNGKETLLRRLPFPLIAVSQSVKDKLMAFGVPAKRIHVVYNSTLDDRFILKGPDAFAELVARRAAITPITFVSVAIITGHKGHREIIEATRAYARRGKGPAIRVVLVGDGPEANNMKQLVASYGLEGMFDFVGASHEVEQHLADAHVFIHLPEAETFGMVLAEANGLGLSCVAANIGGIPEVIVDGETGFLVDRENVEDVAARMEELAVSGELRNRMGHAGSMRAAKMFGRERIARDLARIYGLALIDVGQL